MTIVYKCFLCEHEEICHKEGCENCGFDSYCHKMGCKCLRFVPEVFKMIEITKPNGHDIWCAYFTNYICTCK